MVFGFEEDLAESSTFDGNDAGLDGRWREYWGGVETEGAGVDADCTFVDVGGGFLAV